MEKGTIHCILCGENIVEKDKRTEVARAGRGGGRLFHKGMDEFSMCYDCGRPWADKAQAKAIRTQSPMQCPHAEILKESKRRGRNRINIPAGTDNDLSTPN